jgi:hypothetical protein
LNTFVETKIDEYIQNTNEGGDYSFGGQEDIPDCNEIPEEEIDSFIPIPKNPTYFTYNTETELYVPTYNEWTGDSDYFFYDEATNGFYTIPETYFTHPEQRTYEEERHEEESPEEEFNEFPYGEPTGAPTDLYIYNEPSQTFTYVDHTYPQYTSYFTYNEETNGYYPYYAEPTVYYSSYTPLYIQSEDTGAYYYVDEPTNDYEKYFSYNEETNDYTPFTEYSHSIPLYTYDYSTHSFVPEYNCHEGENEDFGGYGEESDSGDKISEGTSYFYDEYTQNYFSY